MVQNSATVSHVLTQFRQVSGDKLEGFLAASRTVAIRQRDVGIHVAPGLVDRFDQQFHKLLCAFNVVKWSLWPVAHAVFDPSTTAPSPVEFNLSLLHTTIRIKTRLKKN
ncbi:MAG TPA: hypothetical protein VK568_15565 [Thermodesulfobacteriota bacterium]|nr:hypothetical protein [Thermodesulfobacteriota bacterium]